MRELHGLGASSCCVVALGGTCVLFLSTCHRGSRGEEHSAGIWLICLFGGLGEASVNSDWLLAQALGSGAVQASVLSDVWSAGVIPRNLHLFCSRGSTRGVWRLVGDLVEWLLVASGC